MGSVSASARLPLAVSAAGAHGMYPGLSLPPAALAPVLEALVLATAAFGVNFIVPFMDLDSLELAVDQAPYVDFFLADPDDQLVQRVHAGGAHCGWQVESVDEARAAEAAGCDVVIAKAWESGGRKRIEGPTLLARAEEVHSRPRGTQRAPSKPCRSTRARRSARFAWCSPPRRSLPSSPPGCRARPRSSCATLPGTVPSAA